MIPRSHRGRHIFLQYINWQKVNVKLSFWLLKRHAIKAYGGGRLIQPDGVEWSGLHNGRFDPMERTPDIHRIGGWVGFRAGLKAVAKRKFMSLPGIEPRSSSHYTEIRYIFFSVMYKVFVRWDVRNSLVSI